jgi:hypothetical protein
LRPPTVNEQGTKVNDGSALAPWDIYAIRPKVRWLGSVVAPTAEEAIAKAVTRFRIEARRLVAIRRG